MMLHGPIQVPRRFAGMVADEWLDLRADEAGDGTLLIVRIVRE
jgi:hypothetical protein